MQQWYRQTHRCICSQLAIKGCSFHVPCLLGTLYFTPIVGMISYLTNSYQMLNLNALMLLFGSRSSSDKNKNNHDFEIIQSCSSQYFSVLQWNKYHNSNDTIWCYVPSYVITSHQRNSTGQCAGDVLHAGGLLDALREALYRQYMHACWQRNSWWELDGMKPLICYCCSMTKCSAFQFKKSSCCSVSHVNLCFCTCTCVCVCVCLILLQERSLPGFKSTSLNSSKTKQNLRWLHWCIDWFILSQAASLYLSKFIRVLPHSYFPSSSSPAVLFQRGPFDWF